MAGIIIRKCASVGCEKTTAPGERLCPDCMVKGWMDNYITKRPDHLPCGHPLSAAHYSRDGTAYCYYCEAEAAG